MHISFEYVTVLNIVSKQPMKKYWFLSLEKNTLIWKQNVRRWSVFTSVKSRIWNRKFPGRIVKWSLSVITGLRPVITGKRI